MSPVKNKTDHQIRLMGFQALQKELGIVGLIRFMQQFALGSGNYVKDREAGRKIILLIPLPLLSRSMKNMLFTPNDLTSLYFAP